MRSRNHDARLSPDSLESQLLDFTAQMQQANNILFDY